MKLSNVEQCKGSSVVKPESKGVLSITRYKRERDRDRDRERDIERERETDRENECV